MKTQKTIKTTNVKVTEVAIGVTGAKLVSQRIQASRANKSELQSLSFNLKQLEKHDVGSLKFFCSEFGYDVDSISANKIYKAVKAEYMGMCSLFSDAEMEELAEIN